jgi:predicted anti-sigma-YlaC factor YlaD
MKKLMHILFLSCLKATELIEKKLSFRLSAKEKIQLKAHKMMCSACRNYEKQSVLIEKVMENREELKEYKLDLEQFKVSLIEKLKEDS